MNLTSQEITKHLDAKEFDNLIQTRPGRLIDVRTPGEYQEGHIKGAELINIYSGDFTTRILGQPKSEPVYIYCRSGQRSRSAANFLEKNGYTRIFNLDRGMIDWAKNNMPVEK